MKKTWLILVVIAALPVSMGGGLWGAEVGKSHYWELGVGSYGAGIDGWCEFTDLDRARMDWVMLTFGNPPHPSRETTEMLNRFLRINPHLKIMVRLWPISGLGYEESRYQATFLDYLYKEGVKEQLLQEISQQIHSVLDYIDKPENVVGFTFLEELPGHFTGGELNCLEENELSWHLKRYQENIEAERGKPLTWNEDARRWWGERFVQVINEINQHIKKESGGKWVFIWMHTNYEILDYYPEGTNLSQERLVPFHYRDVIKPGYCDGFFAYPNNKEIWQRYIDLATRNNWLFFSQLSHPGTMRLCSWHEAVRLAEMKIPQNLGYFFYCEGNCRRGAWNDDPSIPTDDNFHRASIRSHYRRHCAQRGVGIDIIKQHLRPQLQLGYDFEAESSSGYYAVQLLVHNTRDESWYLSEQDTVLKNVKISLELPPPFTFEQQVSQLTTVELGDLKPDKYTVAWWPRARGPVEISKANPVRAVLTADNCPRVRVRGTSSKSVIKPKPFYEASHSGEKWVYPGFHLPHGPQPTVITVECIADAATNPALTINGQRIMWKGSLKPGQTLVIRPGNRAVLKDGDNPEGLDVSDRLVWTGAHSLTLRELNYITYADDDPPSPITKLRIKIEVGVD